MHMKTKFIVENGVNIKYDTENVVLVLLTVYFLDQFIDLYIENGVMLQLFFHCLDRRHDSGMVTAEDFTDIWKGHIGDLTDQIYGDMSCRGNILGASGPYQIVAADTVFFEYCRKYFVDGHVDRLGPAQQLGDTISGQLHGNVFSVEKA